MNKYKGVPGGSVRVNGERLPQRLDVFNHSPTGFGWGYGGSGPAQLALAILVYEYGDDLIKHPAHYQRFKDEVVAKLDRNKEFLITSEDIANWLSQ